MEKYIVLVEIANQVFKAHGPFNYQTLAEQWANANENIASWQTIPLEYPEEQSTPPVPAQATEARTGKFKPIINLLKSDDSHVFIGTDEDILDRMRCTHYLVLETENETTFTSISPTQLKEYAQILSKPDPLCPECKQPASLHLALGLIALNGKKCDMVYGRRGWRQLGVYDG